MYKYFKRFFDLFSALILFTAISPIFISIAILVRLKLGTPIFFKQERAGLYGKSFYIYKFRTMTDAKDARGNYLPDHQRLIPFGKWLRSSSLDELPELINIIKGEMAVIGPRPLPPEYNNFFTTYEKYRFHVRGGLIPPESIYHDSFLTWNQQLKYEADYANNLSLSMDLKILFSVFKTIFKRTKTEYGKYERKPLTVERQKN